MKMKMIVLVTLAAFLTLGFSCVNDNFVVTINLQGITGTFKVNTGDGAFNSCVTIFPNQYVDSGYLNANLKDARIYDIRVSTIGNYAGTLDGVATVNGATALSFQGSYAYFNTPRSVLADPNVTRNAAGIFALVNAVKNRQSVTLCGVGSVTPGPFPDGQYVKIEILGQIDAEP